MNEIQQVYRLQGVGINDKHIEVIVRQMLRRVRVKDVGDTNFLVDEQVEKHLFEKENERILERERPPGDRRGAAPRHHQGQPLDGVVHQRLVVPGDDQGAHRGGDLRQDRRSPRPQGERHHGSAHPGRHGPARRTSASRSSSKADHAAPPAYVAPRVRAEETLSAVNEE